MRDLPGFYWDESKGRYFKIPPGGGNQLTHQPAKQPTSARSSSRAGRGCRQDSKRRREQPQTRRGRQHGDSSGKSNVCLAPSSPQVKFHGMPVLLRDRETGYLATHGLLRRLAPAHTVQPHINEARAKSIATLRSLANSPDLSLANRATTAVEFLPLRIQTESGLKCIPSVLCGSSSHKCITQLSFLPKEGDGLAFDMNPAWHQQYSPHTTAAYTHSSTSTFISPWRQQQEAEPSMVGFCWLGGGALAGEFTFHSAQGVMADGNFDEDDESQRRNRQRSFRTTFPRQAGVSVRGTIWCSDMLSGRLHVALGTSIGSLVYDLQRSGQVNQPLLKLPSHGSDVLTQTYFEGSSVLRGLRNGWINQIDTRQPYRSHRSATSSLKMKSSVTHVQQVSQMQIIGASVNGHIAIWDMRKQDQIVRFPGHQNSYTRYNVALSKPGGSLLAAGGTDKCVRVWSTRNGRLLAKLGPFSSTMPWCSFACSSWSEADILCCGGESGISILGPAGYL